MDLIEERLHLTRGGMMLLSILLGCDYLPGGVHGVGRDTAVRFIKEVYAAGDRDPTQRCVLHLMREWEGNFFFFFFTFYTLIFYI